MRTITTLLVSFSLLSVGFTFAQNLVPNPSFEEYTQCPDGQCQIMRATGWMSFGYTPDYYNACSINPDYSVPSNNTGFQYAASGDAYAQFCAYSEYSASLIRDYIGIKLIEDLEIGENYYFSMKVSLVIRQNFSTHACNKVGMKLSTVSYDLDVQSCSGVPSALFPPSNFAHVYTNDIVSDTLNWVTISGYFIADSVYKYLIIGNFFDNTHTSILDMGATAAVNISTYLVDDVYLSIDTANSIGQQLETYIFLYPNPANNLLTIRNEFFSGVYTLRIFDTQGQQIKTVEITQAEQTISVAGLPSGLYIIQIQTSKQVFYRKLKIVH